MSRRIVVTCQIFAKNAGRFLGLLSVGESVPRCGGSLPWPESPWPHFCCFSEEKLQGRESSQGGLLPQVVFRRLGCSSLKREAPTE